MLDLKRNRIGGAAFLMMLVIASCVLFLRPAIAIDESKVLKVGFILSGPANDNSWNSTHFEGRQLLQKTLGDRVQTTVIESVPENAQVERVLQKLISQGNKLIFCTSYGHFEPMLRVAARNPSVSFMQCQRWATAKNVGTYFGSMWDPFYVAGFVAGSVTKKNRLGYVGGQPIPILVACVNAFALGAQKANPKTRVSVIWTNSWMDHVAEAEAAKALIESGADVIASFSSTAVKTAEQANVYSIGSDCDVSKLAPKGWLVGQVWDWGPIYVKYAQDVSQNKWKADNYRYSMKDGYSTVSSFGKAVPAAVQAKATQLKQKMESGELVVFKGPLKDQKGVERLAPGKTMGFKELESETWFVNGVDGVNR